VKTTINIPVWLLELYKANIESMERYWVLEVYPERMVYPYSDQFYISRNIRACNSWNAAYIETVELAEKFREYCLPIIKRRYGSGSHVEVVGFSTPDDSERKKKKNMIKMKEDSEIVRGKIGL